MNMTLSSNGYGLIKMTISSNEDNLAADKEALAGRAVGYSPPQPRRAVLGGLEVVVHGGLKVVFNGGTVDENPHV